MNSGQKRGRWVKAISRYSSSLRTKKWQEQAVMCLCARCWNRRLIVPRAEKLNIVQFSANDMKARCWNWRGGWNTIHSAVNIYHKLSPMQERKLLTTSHSLAKQLTKSNVGSVALSNQCRALFCKLTKFLHGLHTMTSPASEPIRGHIPMQVPSIDHRRELMHYSLVKCNP